MQIYKNVYTVTVVFYGELKNAPQDKGDYVMEMSFRELPELTFSEEIYPNMSAELVECVKERFSAFQQSPQAQVWDKIEFKRIEHLQVRTAIVFDSDPPNSGAGDETVLEIDRKTGKIEIVSDGGGKQRGKSWDEIRLPIDNTDD